MHIKNPNKIAPEENGLNFNPSPNGTLVIQIQGDWKIGNQLPSADEVEKKLRAETGMKRVGFDTSELKGWDSVLPTFLIKLKEYCSQKKIPLETEALPEGVRRLLSGHIRGPGASALLRFRE